MKNVRSFGPVVGKGARALILGSMPGEASLAARQYYAHPRNAFWRIMSAIFGAKEGLSYASRLRLLTGNGIALWDVLGSCARRGSSDSAIERSSMRPNDLAGFLPQHPGIRRVFFNGAKAEECYRRHVLASLPPGLEIEYRRLPSTSPAHAGVTGAAKLKAWRAALAAR